MNVTPPSSKEARGCMPRRRAVSHGSKLPIRHKGARVGASRLSVHRPRGGVSVHLHVPPPTASARARGARAGKDCAIEVGRARALPARACAMRYANQAMRPRRGTNSLRTRSAARAREGPTVADFHSSPGWSRFGWAVGPQRVGAARMPGHVPRAVMLCADAFRQRRPTGYALESGETFGANLPVRACSHTRSAFSILACQRPLRFSGQRSERSREAARAARPGVSLDTINASHDTF